MVRKIALISLATLLTTVGLPGMARGANSLSDITILSSENISTNQTPSNLSVYLNTFRPSTQIFFKVVLNNSETTTVTAPNMNLTIPPKGAFQFQAGRLFTPTWSRKISE